MRAIIILAALLVTSASAETIATLPTKAGGEIRLTDEQSNCPANRRFSYIRTTTGNVLVGCWQMLDGDVFVQWRDQTEPMLYPSSEFTIKAQPAKQSGRSM